MAAQNGNLRHRQTNGSMTKNANGVAAKANEVVTRHETEGENSATLLDALICIGGIYASFLTWALLQERITKTNYGTETNKEVFKYSIVLNTIQSTLAALLSYVYILATRKTPSDLPVFPTTKILWPLGLVSITSSLASPFGYASLQYVDYITFILAKSCKLIPVMLVHVTLYRKKYPFWKYGVVALVTAGVAIFTLYQSTGSKKNKGASSNSLYGLMLLGINLIFDGLTNSTQDQIKISFKGYSGKQMMCALNLISTLLTSAYLILLPYIAQSGIGGIIGLDLSPYAAELQDAVAFVQRHPAVGWDVLGFAVCGALGQIFIFMTLAKFDSLLLVTITVTRKMVSMIISVLWFGHSLSGMQWLGVGLVFGGIGMEAELSKREKRQKVGGKKNK